MEYQTWRIAMQRSVTDRIFASALDCTYKCFLQLNGHHGTKCEYEEHTEQFDAMYQVAALNHLQAQYSPSEIIHTSTLISSALTLDKQLVVMKHVEAKGLASDETVLIRNSDSFEPVFFYRHEEVSSREKLLLGYKATVFSERQRESCPPTGRSSMERNSIKPGSTSSPSSPKPNRFSTI
jgi:hypothetical protein